MEITVQGHIPTTGDCGHKFDVPLARMEEHFRCPVCGHEDRFTEQQIGVFKSQIMAAAGKAGTEQIGKALSDSLAKSARGLKHVKYRKK